MSETKNRGSPGRTDQKETKTEGRLELVDFFATYPEPEDVTFPAQIAARREFAQTAARAQERIVPGRPLPQQEFVGNYLGAYDRLALFWGTGSGKLCGAVNPAERFKRFEALAPQEGLIRGAIILVPGPGLEAEYYRQIACRCAPGQYATNRTGKGAASLFEPWYRISTWRTFFHPGVDLDQLSREHAGKYLVIDEAHGLANLAGVKDSTYDLLHRFIHRTPNLKVVVSTATPMFDQPHQFAPIMNLLLPLDQQLPIGEASKEYWNTVTLEELEPYLRGRVSYVRTPESDAVPVHQPSEFVPEGLDKYLTELGVGPAAELKADATPDPLDIGRARYDPTYWLPLSKLQQRSWLQLMADQKIGEESAGVSYTERSLITAVFPDGSIKDLRGHYITSLEGPGQRFAATPTFARALREKKTLAELSPRYAACLDIIGDGRQKSFCSFEYIEDTGAQFFALALEAHGFQRYTRTGGRGAGRTGGSLCGSPAQAEGIKLPPKARRYVLITSENIKNSYDEFFRVFNHPDNYAGEYLEIIIGTAVLNEGYSMADTVRVFTFHYHWNRSRPYQGESRAVRAGSHVNYRQRTDAPADEPTTVAMYRFASYYPGRPLLPTTQQTADVRSYIIALRKDIGILRVFRMAKECAVDAIINRQRNRIQYGTPFTASCDYTVCDYESVAFTATAGAIAGLPPAGLDSSTYERYYLTALYDDLEPYVRGAFETTNSHTLASLDHILRPSFAEQFPPEVVSSTVRGEDATDDPFPRYLGYALERMVQRHDLLTDSFGFPSRLTYAPEAELYYLQRTQVDHPDTLFYYDRILSQVTFTLAEAAERAMPISEADLSAQYAGLDQTELVESFRQESGASAITILERALLHDAEDAEDDIDAAAKDAFTGYWYRLRKPVALLTAGTRRKSKKRNKINIAGIDQVPFDATSTVPVYIHFLSVWRDVRSQRTGYNVASSYYNPPELRILDPTVSSQWRDLTPTEEAIYQPIIQYLNLSKQLNFRQYPFFGLILDDNKFRIAETVQPGQVRVDSRNLSRGINCRSIKPLDAANKLWYLIQSDVAPSVPRFTLPEERKMARELKASRLYDATRLGPVDQLSPEQLAQSYMILQMALRTETNIDEFDYLYEAENGMSETRFKYAYVVASVRTEAEKCAELLQQLQDLDRIVTPRTPIPADYRGPLLP